MYEIRFKGSKAKKDFKHLVESLSPKLKEKLKNTLEKNPYPSPTHGTLLNKVEKKGQLYCYPVSGGDRILYDIVDLGNDKSIVFVHFSGDDDGEIRYLRKYAK